MIKDLRVLPPLAIARLRAAPTAMDNYDVVVGPERPLGYRHACHPAPKPVQGGLAAAFASDAWRQAAAQPSPTAAR